MIIRINFCVFHVAICGILSLACPITRAPQPEEKDKHGQSIAHNHMKPPRISAIIPTSDA